MQTNLIQNYINTAKPAQQASFNSTTQNHKKPVPDFDIKKELNNRTFIKPLPAKGHLVKNSIFDAPAVMLNNMAYSVKALKNGIAGKANDHELGKLNDMGMMLGGLAIASYLVTRRNTPLTKGMEFIGLGTFFASMALWPKLAIQFPTRVIHGFHSGQKYEDSQGRKKPVFQDNQYIPWDLYSDEEIQKIGNRMRVSKDIPNRREFIQEKMRKVALQNNTLWMLTAGFATPTMTAMACNLVEKPYANMLNAHKNKMADNLLNNVSESSKKFVDNSMSKKINVIKNLHLEDKLDDKLFGDLAKVLTEGIDAVTSKGITKDLRKMLMSTDFVVSKETAKTISTNLRAAFEKTPFAKELAGIFPSEDDLLRHFESESMMNKSFKQSDMSKLSSKIVFDIREEIRKYNAMDPPKAIKEEFVICKLRHNNLNTGPIESGFAKFNVSKLNGEAFSKINRYIDIMKDFKARNAVLCKYAYVKFANAPETVLAHYWNETMGSLSKTFNFTAKEIENTRFDRELVNNLLRDKIETIVTDDTQYKKVLSELASKLKDLEAQVGQLDTGLPQNYKSEVEALFNSTGEALDKIGMPEAAKKLRGVDSNPAGSLKNVEIEFVKDRLLGVKSTLNRLINTMDVFKRISSGDRTLLNSLPQDMPIEAKEELVELCKKIMLQGHSSDHAIKFHMLRNPDAAPAFGDLKVENGKVVYQYYDPKRAGMVDMPFDSKFYQRAMDLMFGDTKHHITEEVLSDLGVDKIINKNRKDIMEFIGAEEYFAKPYHKIGPSRWASSMKKFALLGVAPDELFFKTLKSQFNTNKWLKMVAVIGGSLLGTTLISQFFFGKIQSPEKLRQKAENND